MNHLKISSGELAKICGVSQGTIDRALNNRPDIKKETKEKILKAAKLYGYRKHIDSSAEKEYAGQIGIIIFNLNNEYFSNLVMEVENRLKEMGYFAVVMLTHYDKEREIECIRSMYNMGASGIILCAVNSGESFENYLSMFDIPIVAVGNDIGGIPYVGIDDFSAMRDMTESVIKDGYKNLIYYSPALKYNDAYAQINRYNGFMQEGKSFNIKVITDIKDIEKSLESLISLDGVKSENSESYKNSKNSENSEDSENLKNSTAIICSTDLYAMEVYIKLNKTGDVKITGFDNLKTIEKYKIPVDSVGYSVTDIAKAAIDVIVCNKKDNIILEHEIIKHKTQ